MGWIITINPIDLTRFDMMPPLEESPRWWNVDQGEAHVNADQWIFFFSKTKKKSLPSMLLTNVS